MERHFEKELESLTTTLIKQGSLVEESIRLALKSLLENDTALASKVVEGDERINSLEIEIDNAIIDILALHQPVASDLRLIIAAQKINNDMERIGDHAVNIAESALSIGRAGGTKSLLELPVMVEIAQAMLRDAIDSFIQLDPSLARSVLKRDDQVDELNRKMTVVVIDLVKAGKETIENGFDLMRVSRNLERIADLATNIAEEVIFHTQARIVKHRAEERKRI